MAKRRPCLPGEFVAADPRQAGRLDRSVIAFDHAFAILNEVARVLGAEHVPIGDAHRRVLAEPVLARVDSPPADVSAMDGYAVRDEDMRVLPARLRVIGESFAGAGCSRPVQPRSCIRIFTGAPIPTDANRIIIQESVVRQGDDAVIEHAPGTARHIRRRGSDFRAGDLLLEAGVRLGYRQLVAAAGGDYAELTMWRRPRVSILATGDELADPGFALGRVGMIPESISFGASALCQEWGAVVTGRHHLRDDLPSMEVVAAAALEQSDLIVVTGGASVGEKDFAKAMFESHRLELLFSTVAMRPGKPVWLGRASGKLVMGLPGNPTSALVTARLLLAPLVAGLSGLEPQSAHRWRKAPLLAPIPACGDRETFVRARAVENGVEPLAHQDSSAQKTLVDADLLIRRRPGAAAAETGDMMSVLEF